MFVDKASSVEQFHLYEYVKINKRKIDVFFLWCVGYNGTNVYETIPCHEAYKKYSDIILLKGDMSQLTLYCCL